jgi:hypothetical protein
MEHFSEQPWVDFVRGVSGPEINTEIEAHLAAGCSSCKKAHEAWNLVQRLVTAESAYAPPENLVRLVKLAVSGRYVKQPPKWTLGSLIFDSLAQPLPVGVRSGTLNVWQVIFEAEGLTVDLHLRRRAQSKQVHIVGQVFDKQALRALQNNVNIELSTQQDQLVATAAVSDSGEFHLEYEAKDDLWLSVKAAGRNPVRIPLNNPR